ncbi:MAG TPA: segregation/condensation protein A [Candidatus Limnocylindrales bacterium]|nr:segregation/condensation protein A [Candidatus Limnocylindrales bacterium]
MGSETPNGGAGIAVHLEVFEGPLDLLLHLIREDKLDIHDIPIARITEQYLSYLEAMKALNLDIAGEFLVMAATLIYIKSKSLLPRTDEELEPEEDPEIMRAELSRRLIEYRKFKEAAARLSDRPILGRDVFARDFLGEEIPGDEVVITELSLADLITAFKDVLERMPKDEAHQVFTDRLTIADAIAFLLDRIREEGSIRFDRLLEEFKTKNEIISFFLGILELVRLRTVKVYQANPMGLITIVPAVREVENGRESEDPDIR